VAWTARAAIASAEDAGAPAPPATDAGASAPPATSASPSAPPASSATPPAPPAASAQATPSPRPRDSGDKVDYTTKRYELAGFPLIGGDSDIGFEFGGVATLSRFANGIVPYQWNMDLLLAASVKSGPSGLEFTQENVQWNIDVPGLVGGRVRINPQVAYNRTINQLYFGIGNASSAQAPPGASPRYFEFDDRQARVRALTRIVLRAPLDAVVGAIYRFEDPGPYLPSKLATDAASGVALGVEPLSLVTLAAGVLYDTRDSEIFPHQGSYHQIGLRGTLGMPTGADVRYGEAGAMLAIYRPIEGPFVLALRGVVDLQFGNVPAYDLYTGGPFQTYEMPGGSAAIRGVPEGRYSGLVKVLGNAELRALLVELRVLGQRFRLGGNLLFDAGRLWANYTFSSPLDGSGLGIKWGAGAGFYLVWGQAAVFRIEVAYSPDATSENSNLPLGIYVEDGVMF
jgi:surface antigen Omp85-like protein